MQLVRKTLVVAGKDLLRLRRDRFALGFALGFPAAFSVAFFFMLTPVLADVAGAAPPLPIAMTTAETAPAAISSQVIAGLVQTAHEGLEFRVLSPSAARTDFESGELEGYIAFPGDFTEAVLSGSGTQLNVYAGSDPPQQAALESVAEAVAFQVQLRAATATVLAGINAPAAAYAAPAAASIRFDTVDVGGIEPPNAADTTVPGYLVMFVFMAAAFTAAEVARERASGTLARMVAAGASPGEVVLGKFLSTAALGVVQVIVLGAFGILAFGMDLGLSPAASLFVALLMVLVSSAFGIMLASLVRTERAAVPAAILTALVAAPLGGCWWPLFVVPDWMQSLALVTPHGWANTAFNRLMLFGGQFESVLSELLALAAFAGAFAAIALWRFRNAPLID